MKNNLAIIIPAYKISYFKESITAIANQTCKDFTLYIGDDASPNNFIEIIDFFKDKINIVYKRFNENFGGKDLVSHWKRCIDMIQNEEWIWLFSDDDLMDKNCVELFYKHIEKHKNDKLVHFNIDVINENNIKIFKTKRFSSHFSTTQYFYEIINHNVYSCTHEYIFKRDIFEKVNGFEPFDLAWCSDNATWMKLSLYGGINTIDGAIVRWRLSTLNISSKSDDRSIVLRKTDASIKYLNWARFFFEKNNLTDFTSRIEKFRWLLIGIVYTTTLTSNEKYTIIIDSLKRLNFEKIKFQVMGMWLYEEFKRSFKSAIAHKAGK